MKKLTKRKWMAKLGLTKVCCPKCGNRLNPRGYYYLMCTKCNYHRQESFGHFWSEDSSERKDPFINQLTGEFKE
jgi:tRNA(Ile2) C34 agmatinyltransferase TiaS